MPNLDQPPTNITDFNWAWREWIHRMFNDGILGDISWMPLTLQNGWANYGSGYSAAEFRQLGGGLIEIKGRITGGIQTGGTVIATLPIGYRPAETREFVIAAGSSPIFSTAVIDVTNAGGIVIADAPSSTMSLDNISFFAEE